MESGKKTDLLSLPGPLGLALMDELSGKRKNDLLVNCDRSPTEKMNIPMLLSEYKDWNVVEKTAVNAAKGFVLDLGGGAGRHSLWLQNNGSRVEVIDSDVGCVEVMRIKGIKNVIHGKWQTFEPAIKYDTILSLMNGAGLAGTENDLPFFIKRLRSWLNPGGQLLMDTSTIEYLNPSIDKSRMRSELLFQFEYGKIQSEWFSWLFAPYRLVLSAMQANGLYAEKLIGNNKDRALIRGLLN